MKQVIVTNCTDCQFAVVDSVCWACKLIEDNPGFIFWEGQFEHCPLKNESITITLKPTNNESNPNQ